MFQKDVNHCILNLKFCENRVLSSEEIGNPQHVTLSQNFCAASKPAAVRSQVKFDIFFSVINWKFDSEDGDALKDPCNDRVAIAFAKFDLDDDGYLSWEEFREVYFRNNLVWTWTTL